LFQNTFYFVQLTLHITDDHTNHLSDTVLSDQDMAVAVEYATLAAVPIHAYTKQYGKNSIKVSQTVLKYEATVPWVSRYSPSQGRYDDGTLQSWVDDIAATNALPAGGCVVILNPPYGFNSLADETNAGGYHNATANGPYIWCSVEPPFSVNDPQNHYAWILSHEMAEVVVDPDAYTNPEVCDPCSAVCGDNYVHYFDLQGRYIDTVSYEGFSPPVPTFAYAFWIVGIISRAYAGPHGTPPPCPNDQAAACKYPPPFVPPWRGNVSVEPVDDAKWLIEIWRGIHQGDPGPIDRVQELLSTVRAIEGLARCLGDARAEREVFAALGPVMEHVSELISPSALQSSETPE
jgi:hypothetical protein